MCRVSWSATCTDLDSSNIKEGGNTCENPKTKTTHCGGELLRGTVWSTYGRSKGGEVLVTTGSR